MILIGISYIGIAAIGITVIGVIILHVGIGSAGIAGCTIGRVAGVGLRSRRCLGVVGFLNKIFAAACTYGAEQHRYPEVKYTVSRHVRIFLHLSSVISLLLRAMAVAAVRIHGDPNGNRTRVAGVRGRCPNR